MTSRTDVDKMILELQKKHGADLLMRMKDRPKSVPVIPTGSKVLDRATGIGGYPRGRVIEIFGVESGGKTTLSLHAIAEVQKLGEYAAFVDAEHALDLKYAQNLGVNTDELLISQPNHGEQALNLTVELANSGNIALIVVDSVAALVPKAELDGEIGDSHMGLHARLMSQSMRMLCGAAAKHNCAIIFINQLRTKIGVVFGNPNVTTGGGALKFYASMRLDVSGSERRKDANDEAIGKLTRVKIVKNKLAPPFREAEFDIIYGHGIDQIGETITLAVEQKVLTKNGSYFIFRDQKLANGYNAMHKKLESDPELRKAIEIELQ